MIVTNSAQAAGHPDLELCFSYDHLGRRVSKSTTAIAAQGAETVLFIYDQWNVIQEWSSPTLDKAYLVWGDDLSATSGRELVGQGQQAQRAGGVGGLLMRQITGGQTLYYHYDANGNPARLTNATNNGGIYRYDAFGNIRTARGALVDQIGENPWQFSTKYHDPETGFSYYGYRYYDPVTGRWPSRDPLGENWATGEFNEYAFILNEPLSGIDILGEKRGGARPGPWAGPGGPRGAQRKLPDMPQPKNPNAGNKILELLESFLNNPHQNGLNNQIMKCHEAINAIPKKKRKCYKCCAIEYFIHNSAPRGNPILTKRACPKVEVASNCKNCDLTKFDLN